MTNLAKLLEQPNAVCGLDAYGVIYNNSGFISSSRSVVEFCNTHNIPVFLFTNNTTQTPTEIATNCKQAGYNIPADRVISSGCGCYMLPTIKQQLENATVYVYGYPSSRFYPETAGATITNNIIDADTVVFAASLNHQNHHTYRLIAKQLDQGQPLRGFCINPDHYVQHKQQLYPVMGYYARQLEVQCNTQWTWIGKPFSIYSELVSQTIINAGYNPKNLVFCDDNPINVQQLVQDLNCTGVVITNTGVFYRYKHQVTLPDILHYLPQCDLQTAPLKWDKLLYNLVNN